MPTDKLQNLEINMAYSGAVERAVSYLDTGEKVADKELIIGLISDGVVISNITDSNNWTLDVYTGPAITVYEGQYYYDSLYKYEAKLDNSIVRLSLSSTAWEFQFVATNVYDIEAVRDPADTIRFIGNIANYSSDVGYYYKNEDTDGRAILRLVNDAQTFVIWKPGTTDVSTPLEYRGHTRLVGDSKVFIGGGTDITFEVDGTIDTVSPMTKVLQIEQDGTLSSMVTAYETLVLADNDIPNRKFVVDAISASGSLTNRIENTLTTSYLEFGDTGGDAFISGNLEVTGDTRMFGLAEQSGLYVFDVNAQGSVFNDGKRVLAVHTTQHNIFIGDEITTDAFLVTSLGNIVIGHDSGIALNGGDYNTIIGQDTGNILDTGQSNVFIGQNAGNAVNDINYSVSLGILTVPKGDYAVSIGYTAGGGIYDVAIGRGAGNVGAATQQKNVMIGFNAKGLSASGDFNIMVGDEAGKNAVGDNNIVLGDDAGQHTDFSGSGNIFAGQRSGYNTTTGETNVYIGNYTGYNTITGVSNIFIGQEAGYYETESNTYLISNQRKTTEATHRAGALMYGVMNATTSNQTLQINAQLQLFSNTTYFDVDGSNNLTLTDAITGTKTLAELSTVAAHEHGSYDRATSVLSSANVFSDIIVANGIVTGTATRALTAGDIGAATSGHEHTTFDRSVADLAGATVFDRITVLNGIVTAVATRELTASNIGALASGANAVSATLASTITITANNSTNETVYPVFVEGATGTQGLESDTGYYYNPSTGDLTAVDFVPTSDLRQKEEVNYDLSKISIDGLKPISYLIRGQFKYGFGAQDMLKTHPELVVGEEESVYSIKLNSIIALNTNEILKLKKENKSLEDRVKRLEQLILNK